MTNTEGMTFIARDLVPVYAALAGALVGALASVVPAAFIDSWKRRRDAAAVTAAIVTEIRVTLSLLERRGYLETVTNIHEHLLSGKITTATFAVDVPPDHSPIYRANIAKVGQLPAALRDHVVMFHQLLDAAIADGRTGGLLNRRPCGEKEFSDLRSILQAAVRTGELVAGHGPGAVLNLD